MSTQHIDQQISKTKLECIQKRSKADRQAVFNNLGHAINVEMLKQCFNKLDGAKAVGTDGITKEKYGANLDANITTLLRKLRNGSYRPKVSRVVSIPKSDGSTRPLVISCFEDKIVQEAVRQILEQIFEPLFLDASHGFRPKRGCATALVDLNKKLIDLKCGSVVEVDLQKFFNTIPHEPLTRMLNHKIKDQRFLRLILRLLKAAVLNDVGVAEMNTRGSPQGSIVSPILANIYLHYALDLWFQQWKSRRPSLWGAMVRYADDVVFVMQTKRDATALHEELKQRLAMFGISLNESKTRIIASGKLNAHILEAKGQKPETFVFLGFVHVWQRSVSSKTGKSFWRPKLFTCSKRFRNKVTQIKEYVSRNRHKRGLLPYVIRIVDGYLNYFSINDNIKRIHRFLFEVRKILFKFLKRRSQRGLSPEKFNRMLDYHKFPVAKVRRNLFFNGRPHCS